VESEIPIDFKKAKISSFLQLIHWGRSSGTDNV
jgi:hypothetical protein